MSLWNEQAMTHTRTPPTLTPQPRESGEEQIRGVCTASLKGRGTTLPCLLRGKEAQQTLYTAHVWPTCAAGALPKALWSVARVERSQGPGGETPG